MSYVIDRHDLDRAIKKNVWKIAEQKQEMWSSKIESDPGTTDMSLSSLWLDVVFSVHADPDAEWLDTWKATVMAMQMHHAVLMMGVHSRGEQLELMINHQVRRVETLGPDSALSASNWTTALFLAAVCRDHARVEQLCEIPVQSLRESGESQGTEYNEFTYRWVGALQAFVSGRVEEFAQELLAAMELSTPEAVSFGDPELLNHVVFPPMNVLLRLVERDSAAFNEALAHALEAYRGYQTADPERARDIESVLPLSLLAIACWAWDLAASDSDFSFEVESGYLPKHLLKGSWRGEFAI